MCGMILEKNVTGKMDLRLIIELNFLNARCSDLSGRIDSEVFFF